MWLAAFLLRFLQQLRQRGGIARAGQLAGLLLVAQGPHDERAHLGRAGVGELLEAGEFGLQPVEGLLAGLRLCRVVELIGVFP
jgi:hypothetical protein